MSDTSLFETCGAEVTEGAYSGVLECVSDRLEERAALQASDLVSWLLVLAGALIFFMQAGFAMLCGGCVRKKNLQNTMLKNLLDACGAAIAFYCVGYAFAFGGQNNRTDITFIGNTNFFSMGEVDQAFWFFEYAFSATSVTIVAGTLAERCQMVAYLCYSLFLTGLVYPVVAHSIWSNNGFLSAFSADPLWGIGCIDFAGSGVVHLTGGTTALIATYILGARKGRFYDSRGRELPKPMPFPGHSMALQLMGTMILWFGCKLLTWDRVVSFSISLGRKPSLLTVSSYFFYSYICI
jgi:Amt family ammonium transporter